MDLAFPAKAFLFCNSPSNPLSSGVNTVWGGGRNRKYFRRNHITHLVQTVQVFEQTFFWAIRVGRRASFFYSLKTAHKTKSWKRNMNVLWTKIVWIKRTKNKQKNLITKLIIKKMKWKIQKFQIFLISRGRGEGLGPPPPLDTPQSLKVL